MGAQQSGPWRKEDRIFTDRAVLLLRDVDGHLRDLQNAGLPTSPFSWLVGAHLPEIYGIISKKPAGISRHRKTHSPRGPYLRFVKSVLGALNVTGTHSDETIVRAFTVNKSLSTAARAAAAASAQRELDRFYSRKADLYANCC
jgi:hypothetical protein